MPGLLMAALFLAVRLLASSMAMASPTPNGPAGIVGFCSPNADGSPTPSHDTRHDSSHDHACLVCPACHVAGHASLPEPTPARLPIALGGDIGRIALPPDSTGPPHRPRVSAHPTGPPTA